MGLHPFQSIVKSGQNLGTIQGLINIKAYGYGVKYQKSLLLLCKVFTNIFQKFKRII